MNKNPAISVEISKKIAGFNFNKNTLLNVLT